MFWMKPMMEGMIGMDYERGLRMLRELVETGTVLSKLEVGGVEATPAMRVLGKSATCAFADIKTAMADVFTMAQSYSAACNISMDGAMISVYHKADMKCQQFEFTGGYVVDGPTESVGELTECRLPAGKALRVRHIGSYANLGNAWSGIYQYARCKKLKVAKRDSFEIYRNDPETTPEAELVTDVYLPLKA